MGEWWLSVWCELNLWHHSVGTSVPLQCHPFEWSLYPLLSSCFCLSCYRRFATTLTWLPQSGPVFMCGSLCKLPHSHETQSFVNYLCAHHDQNCLGVGHGGDNQQQHILVIVSYPWNLELYLHKSEVWDGCTPIPSSSNNQPRDWICSCKFIDCGLWGVGHIPLVSPSLFNGFARVAHFLAQPWHQKHCRVLGSFAFWALPWAPVNAWVLPYFGKQWLPYLQQKSCSRGALTQVSLTIVGAWVGRSVPVHPPSPMTPGTVCSSRRVSGLFCFI